MVGRFRSFVLQLGPIRRAVDEEVDRKLEPTVRSAHEALDTHRRTVAALDEVIAGLRADNDEARRRLAELEADNRDLRAALAQREAAPRRERENHRRPRREEPTRDAGTSSDQFRCLECSSLWLLSTTPDHISTVSRPVGPGCPACGANPLMLLRKVKAGLAKAARPDRCATLDGIAWCATGNGLVDCPCLRPA